MSKQNLDSELAHNQNLCMWSRTDQAQIKNPTKSFTMANLPHPSWSKNPKSQLA